MIENGNNENLVLLKKAILEEAESFLKTHKNNLNSENSSDDQNYSSNDTLINATSDLSKTILKIDEFLENLDKNENKDAKEDNKSDCLIYDSNFSSFHSHSDIHDDGLLTSTTTSSNEDSSIFRSSATNDVKSLLKQKLLDVAAKKFVTKESKYFQRL